MVELRAGHFCLLSPLSVSKTPFLKLSSSEEKCTIRTNSIRLRLMLNTFLFLQICDVSMILTLYKMVQSFVASVPVFSTVLVVGKAVWVW